MSTSLKRAPVLQKGWLDYVVAVTNLAEPVNPSMLKRAFGTRDNYLGNLIQKYNLCAFSLIFHYNRKNGTVKARSLVAKRQSKMNWKNKKFLKGFEFLKDFPPLFGEQFWPSIEFHRKYSRWVVSGQGRRYLWPPSWETLWKIDLNFSYKEYATIARIEAQSLKPRLFELQRGKCKYCNLYFSFEKHTVDHVIPLKHGGETSLNNCVLACRSCNSRKSTKDKSETFKKLSDSVCWCGTMAKYRVISLDGRYRFLCAKHRPDRRISKKWFKRVEKIEDILRIATSNHAK